MSRGASTTLLTQLPARTPSLTFPWLRVDRRSKIAREVASNYLRFVLDLGGESNLSFQQLALVERAAFLLYRVRDHEAALMSGRTPMTDAGTHSNQVNVLMGLLAKLGLKRQARDVPDVREYLQVANGR